MDNDNTEMKRCRNCLQEKSVTEFYKRSENGDGLRVECKRCTQNARGHKARYVAPVGMKRCSRCKEDLPATNEYFAADRTTGDGFQSSCKPCQKCIRDLWLEQNRDTDEYKQKNRANVKKWAIENTEKARSQSRSYYETNKAVILAKQREYTRTHQEQGRISKGNWAKANRAKRNAISRNYIHRRRSILLSLPNTFVEADWQRCLDYWHGCCAVCGRQAKDLFGTHTLAQDHWVALTDKRPDNPGNVAANVVPLCHGLNGCNNSKSNQDATTWLIARVGKRKANRIIARVQQYFDWLNAVQ